MRFLPLLLLLLSTCLFAQNRPLTYFSQATFGNPSYTEVGRGIIQAADLNGDSIADIAVGSRSVFQVGYARIEDGRLNMNMQPVNFVEDKRFSRGQLTDVDSDGDIDFSMQNTDASQQPWINTIYVFDNVEDTIQYTPIGFPAIFPENTSLYFGKFNEDEITDAYYRQGDDYLIMDGATGQTYAPIPPVINPFNNPQTIIRDLNGDGMLDFSAQVDFFPGSDTIVHIIYINEGDFVFNSYETREFVTPRNFGDFDGDGILDLIGNTINGTPLSFRIKSNLMSADEAAIFELSLPTPQFNESSIIPYDLNEDGYDDLIAFTYDTVYFCKNNQNQTFEVFNFPQRNDPSSMFFTHHPSWPNGTVICEQGVVEPFFYYFSFDGIDFRVEKTKATVTPPVILEPPYYHRITFLDADMDGKRELAISSDLELVAAEFDNDSFQEYSTYGFDLPELPFFTAMASADFNNDNILDLVYALPVEANPLQICYGQVDSTFSAPVNLADSMNLCFKIDVGDFDNNGFVDFAAAGGLGENERFILFLNQDGTQFIENEIVGARSEVWNIIDPNADGLPDLAISFISINSTRIYMNDGQGQLDSTHTVSGRVAKSLDDDSPYIYTSNGNLLKIDPDGTGSTVMGNANLSFNTRTAYSLDYNLDGLPDLLYSPADFQNSRNDSTFLVLAETTNPWEVQVLQDRYLQGMEDINSDGNPDLLWQIGPQLWVELVDSIVWTSIVEPPLRPLKIFPNPTNSVLKFEGSDDWLPLERGAEVQVYNTIGQLVFSKKITRNTMDVSALTRGAYFLIVKNDAGKSFGGSFIRM